MTDRPPRMTRADALHYIAQGAINIAEGVTTIEPGSAVHRAMEDVCYYEQAASMRLTPAEWTLMRLMSKDEIDEFPTGNELIDIDTLYEDILARYRAGAKPPG